ncbi:hypothetical protein [Lysobacter sp. A3-1-A15]|uniref:hypothetical protein n=1 Tax=Novilysobacter viscosus TaxID=3098602 RepID=UPI002EDA1841
MNRAQADAIARAFLQPDQQREANRARQAREAWDERERRKVAAMTLVGFAIGAPIAHYLGVSFTQGGLWGGITGAAVGWLWLAWRRHRYHAGAGRQ